MHRPGNCCPRCCPWNTSVLLAELNLQEVVAKQLSLLGFNKDIKDDDCIRTISCSGIPYLTTSRLCLWGFIGIASFEESVSTQPLATIFYPTRQI